VESCYESVAEMLAFKKT